MSHFIVLVVGDDIDEQLAPFCEHTKGPGGEEHHVFTSNEEEELKRYETGSTEFVRTKEGSLLLPWDERFRKPGTIGTGTHTHETPADLETVMVPVMVPFKTTYPTFAAFMKDWCGQTRDRKMKKYGHWANPNAKWDWWELGGRWTGMLKMKPGAEGKRGRAGLMPPLAKPGYADQAWMRDIDWDGMTADRLAQYSAMWLAYKEKRAADPDRAKGLAYEIGATPEDTRASYMARAKLFTPFAVLTRGEWLERGSMGWWGTVTDEKPVDEWASRVAELIASLSPDTLLSVVDCHI